jgi:hypothetical protein
MKRPDQYNLDPSEGGATDYKNLPQTGRGNKSHVDTAHQDKQRLEENRAGSKGQPFPPDVPAPSVHTKRSDVEKEIHDEPGAADTEPGKENPAV